MVEGRELENKVATGTPAGAPDIAPLLAWNLFTLPPPPVIDQIMAGPPQCLLQNWLGQHVVLQGQQHACLGDINDGIVRAAQLHDENLTSRRQQARVLNVPALKGAVAISVAPTLTVLALSSLSRNLASLMLLSPLASPALAGASAWAGTDSVSLRGSHEQSSL